MAGDNQHAEQPINLARPSTSEAVRAEPGAAYLAVGDLGTRRGDHAVAVQVSTPTELDAVPEDRQCWVEAIRAAATRRVRTSMPQVDTPSRS